jgi:nucleoid-associated protein YgaU
VGTVDALSSPAEEPAGTGPDARPTDIAPAAFEPAAPAEEDNAERDKLEASEVEWTASTTAATTSAEKRQPHQGADEGTVVVHRGDTLWAIAAATLDDDATDAEIMRVVVRWHEANRDVIGDDPDLILPGQVLRAPA